MNNKLILIDGIPGMGKSTTAQFLYFQMQRKNVSVRWFHEEVTGHPLFYAHENIQNIVTPEQAIRFVEKWPVQWGRVISCAEKYGMIILTSYLLQDGARVLFVNNLERNYIKEFVFSIAEKIKPLNPLFAFLFTSNPRVAMEKLWIKRGRQWMAYFYRVDENTPFAVKRNLRGTSASLALWSEFQEFCKDLVGELTLDKVVIDTSAETWDLYHQQMLQALDVTLLPPKEIEIGNPELYCGFYLFQNEETMSIRIRQSNLGLVSDFLWPEIALIPESKERFWLRSFPLQFVFSNRTEAGFHSVRLEGDDLYGLAGKEFTRVQEHHRL